MSESNARSYLDNVIHNDPTKENELKLLGDNETLIARVVEMARDEDWPTGEFSGSHVKAAGNTIVRTQGTYETFIAAWRKTPTIW